MVELSAARSRQQSSLYNFDWAKLPNYRKALSQVKAGVGHCRIGCVGDSMTSGGGSGSGGGGSLNGAFKQSYPYRLAEYLNKVVPTYSAGFFCDQLVVDAGMAALALYNDALSFGVSWSRDTSFLGVAGYMLKASGGTDALVYTPRDVADRFDIWTRNIAGNGTVTVTDGSGTLATINTASGAGINKTTVTRASASVLPISIQRNGTGADFQLMGVESYNSAIPAVRILNLGAYGSNTGTWTSTGASWLPLQSVVTLDCDLYILDIGTNDRGSALAAATYETRLETIISAYKAVGDVLLVGYTPRTGSNENLEPDYAAARVTAAVAQDVPYLDLSHRWVSYTAANTLGLYTDSVHPNATGYADIAAAHAEIIRPF